MSDTMNLPNLNDAKKRTKKTIETIYLDNEENNIGVVAVVMRPII